LGTYGIEHLLCWTSVQFSMIVYGFDLLPYAAFVFDVNFYGFCIIIIIIIIIIIMLCPRSASVPGNK
jgi:hypothetical protein